METKTKLLVLHDWMLSLGLNEKQQKLYALIYGYSQDGASRMRGTAESLAEWLDCTTRYVQKLTLQLEAKGLVAHEVVYDRKHRCNVTEFWAVLDEDKPEKTKINWKGKGRPVYEPQFVNDHEQQFVNGYEPQFVNHNRVSRYSKNSNIYKNRGGKNSARGAQTTTTTTTGFLFKDSEALALPYSEDHFAKAWELLLQQPAWKEKTPAALALTLQELASVADPAIATYCVNLAIKRGWDDIRNAQKIYEADEDQVLEFARQLNARKEGGNK